MLFMFLLQLAISATESWMHVTDLVYHMRLASMIPKSRPPPSAGRARLPTVALDSPPSDCLYLVVFCPRPSVELLSGERVRKKEYRKVTRSRRPFTNRDDSIAS
jgi:hypothetical protein